MVCFKLIGIIEGIKRMKKSFLSLLLTLLIWLVLNIENLPQQSLAIADSLINEGLYKDVTVYLEEFILNDPENQEAHYMLGQAYDKLSIPGDSGGNNANLYFVLKANEHFKKVIEISPYYDGRIYILGPYSKLTSIWGSMACSYAYNGDSDSAKWAFKYGQQQGGFYPEILEYNKNIMLTCPQNAILFTNGDLDTYPVWFLQMVEDFRKDITIVNLSLLNTGWYIKQLKNDYPYGKNSVNIRLSDIQIEQLQPIEWESKNVSIPAPIADPNLKLINIFQEYSITDSSVMKEGSITWGMPSTFHAGKIEAIRVQDIMVKEIIEANNWVRPIYFAVTCSEDGKIGLIDYLKYEGMAQRLVPEKKSIEKEFINEKVTWDNLENYSFNWLYNDNYKYIEEIRLLLNNYRNIFIRLALYYHSNGQNDRAVKTIDEMESKVPNELIPMKLGLLFEIANLYYDYGDREKFKQISVDVEKIALAELELNPDDVGSYYNPYRILIEIYEKSEQFDELINIWQKLEVMFPNDPNVKEMIEKYKELISDQ